MTTHEPDNEPAPLLVRRLFLDDDPARAEVFLRDYPDAIWVETVPECIEQLAESWDEVHLDHDLGGEVYVDILREDCGMEVVRWLVKQPRPHLKETRFTIHSWNDSASMAMLWHLEALGYQVVAHPFGQRFEVAKADMIDAEADEFVYPHEPDFPPLEPASWWKRLVERWWGRSAQSVDSRNTELPNP